MIVFLGGYSELQQGRLCQSVAQLLCRLVDSCAPVWFALSTPPAIAGDRPPTRPIAAALPPFLLPTAGSKLLYLGGASGTSVSHCSDLVGPEGAVYAVEFSHRSGRDLVNMAKQRPNVIPIIEDARHPQKYRMLVPMVDVVFADVAQPDQARIVGLNAQYFLRNGGHYVISIKASCIDSTAQPEAVFAREVKKLQEMQLKPREQVTLEPYERDHAMVVGVYRPPPKKA